MKKFMLFAAAMLALVACNKNNKNNEPQAPAQKVVLRATVDGGDMQRVAPKDPTAATVNFTWEEGDQVYIISNDQEEMEIFTLIPGSISADGKSANFEGTALSDMSNYMVVYTTSEDMFANQGYEIDYIEDSFKPVIMGSGSGENFLMDTFGAVFKFQLKGNAKLGKIVYGYAHQDMPLYVTMNIEGGLQLTDDVKAVYFPIFAGEHYTTFSFYDVDGNLLASKSQEHDYQEDLGKIITMPVLELNASATPDPKDIFVNNNTFELVLTDKNSVYYITYVYADGLFTCQKVLAAPRDEPEETEDMTTDYAPYAPATKTTGNALTFELGGAVYVDINADANPATCLFRSIEPLSHPELWGVQQIKVNDVDITDKFTMSRDIPGENE